MRPRRFAPDGSGVGMELGTDVGTAVGVSEGADVGGLVGTEVGSGVGQGVMTNWQQAESVSPSPKSVKVRTSRLPSVLTPLAAPLSLSPRVPRALQLSLHVAMVKVVGVQIRLERLGALKRGGGSVPSPLTRL